MRVLKKPLYNWLASIYFVCNFYALNLAITNGVQVLYTLLGVLLIVSLVIYVATLVVKNTSRANLIVLAFLWQFFLFGHWVGNATAEYTALFLLVFLPLCIGWMTKKTTEFESINLGINSLFILMLVLPFVSIGKYWFAYVYHYDDKLTALAALDEHQFPQSEISNSPNYPDVYFIIVDGYSSDKFLRERWGYDNSAFTGEMKELGFYVAGDSLSNHGLTLLSMSSTLNMQYIENNPYTELNDLIYLRTLIANSLVAKTFKAHGYRYYYLNNGYFMDSTITDYSYNLGATGLIKAALNYSKSDLSDEQAQALKSEWENMVLSFKTHNFHESFSDSTGLALVSKILDSNGDVDLDVDEIHAHIAEEKPNEEVITNTGKPMHWGDPRRFMASLDFLKGIPANPQATFSYVHILKPHMPISFDKKGNIVPQSYVEEVGNEKAFFDQLEYINRELLNLIQHLIAASDTPPIIILQADHSTELGLVWNSEGNVKNFDILNAIYVPETVRERYERDFSQEMVPVNTFRIIFNRLFRENYSILPAKHFDLPEGYKAPFKQVDVTEQYGN